MSQDPRHPKRPRDTLAAGEASEDSVDVPKRSEEFWIEDGNIVLVAGETAFRVYRGLLALQSTVFADLFASSSPNAEERYDDCPVIRLTDSPQDLVHLLRALLPTSRGAFLYRSKGDPLLSLNKISAIVRLAHKYHVEDLLRQALSALKDDLTSSFKAWEDESRVLPVNIRGAEQIAAVNLARLTDTPLLLPLALYNCCVMGPDIIDGWEREDGTIEHLAPADLKRCIAAREVLAKEAFSLVSVIFNPEPSEGCTTPTACIVALRDSLASVLKADGAADPTVLDTWGLPLSVRVRCPATTGHSTVRHARTSFSRGTSERGGAFGVNSRGFSPSRRRVGTKTRMGEDQAATSMLPQMRIDML